MSSIFNDDSNKETSKIEYINEKINDKNHVKVIARIYGRVQGVGFRFTTVKLANRMGVNGFVRNEEDGSVYVEASANEKVMEDFISKLSNNPSPSSKVDNVIVEYNNSIADYNNFTDPR